MQVQNKIIEVMLRLAPEEGYNLTHVPGVRILRSNRALAKTPVLYDPGVVIVCQGKKTGFWNDKRFVYDAQHFLAVSVPVPFTMETEASESNPLLAIYIHLDFAIAAELSLALSKASFSGTATVPESMVSSKIGAKLQGAVLRFLGALENTPDAEVLSPILLRELYYHLLTSEQGETIRSALTAQGRFRDICETINFIHLNYSQAMNLPLLASRANMSQPTFHSHFKQVTGYTPIQYIKSVRLHQARMLMVRQSLSAVGAGLAVGYESASQFNREFKRQFGNSPAQEARRLRETFSIPPEHASPNYVSSH